MHAHYQIYIFLLCMTRHDFIGWFVSRPSSNPISRGACEVDTLETSIRAEDPLDSNQRVYCSNGYLQLF